jgi:hypothetical protein
LTFAAPASSMIRSMLQAGHVSVCRISVTAMSQPTETVRTQPLSGQARQS